MRAPLLAFYSKALYRDVARNWPGSGVVYPLLLLAACCAPIVVLLQLRAFGPLAAWLAPLVAQIPPITIAEVEQITPAKKTEGKPAPRTKAAKFEVSVDATQPYFIRDDKTGKAIAILDTTGKVSSLKGTEARLLLTRTQLFIRQATGEVVSQEASDLPFRSMDSGKAALWVWWLRGPLAIALFLVLVPLAYVYALAQNAVCAGVGLLLVRNRRWQFNYRTVMRLASVAATPAALLATAAILAGLRAPLPIWLAACFAVSVGYLLFAIRAATELRGSDLEATPDLPSFSVD